MPKKNAQAGFSNLSVSDAIKRFHKDRMTSLIKDSKCEGCENFMRFKALEHSLILSCGSERGKCGDQVEIKLPTYQNYDLIRSILKDMNQYNDDIYDLSRYDLEKVVKAHDFSDDFKERVKEGKDIRDKYKEELVDIKRSYLLENNAKDKDQLIREVARHRHKIARERLKLEQSIATEDDSMKRENYRRELAKLAIRERSQVIDPLQKLKEPMIRMWSSDDGGGVFPTEESSVVEMQSTYRSQDKKKKKKKKKSKSS